MVLSGQLLLSVPLMVSDPALWPLLCPNSSKVCSPHSLLLWAFLYLIWSCHLVLAFQACFHLWIHCRIAGLIYLLSLTIYNFFSWAVDQSCYVDCIFLSWLDVHLLPEFLTHGRFFLLINSCIFRVQYATDVVVMGFCHGLFDKISGVSVFFPVLWCIVLFCCIRHVESQKGFYTR